MPPSICAFTWSGVTARPQSTAQTTFSTLMVPSPATEISAPGSEEFYLYGTGVQAPPPGTVYHVWLVSDTGTPPTHVGELPYEDGVVFLVVPLDPGAFSDLLVTVEPAGSTPSAPGEVVWSAAA